MDARRIETKMTSNMNCKAFEEAADVFWQRWVEASNTEDPAQWDAALESYTTEMEELRVAYGHPRGKPRARP
jgi:hypothetical protein